MMYPLRSRIVHRIYVVPTQRDEETVNTFRSCELCRN
jgi:hypothetical protein